MITNITIYTLVKDLIILENKLNEGLIMTHDIHTSKESLFIYLSSNGFFSDITIDNNKILINTDTGTFNTATYLEFLILINNLGYFISNIKATNKNSRTNIINSKDFKELYLTDEFLKNIIEYEFIIEPKFDIKHQLKTNILYHVTEIKYLDRILKNGLIAKSKNTKGFHPERIYLVYNIEDANSYIKSKNFYYLRNYNKIKQPNKSKYQEIEYVILKIELPINNNIVFFEDPNFKDKGIYTYNNISPENISVINDN